MEIRQQQKKKNKNKNEETTIFSRYIHLYVSIPVNIDRPLKRKVRIKLHEKSVFASRNNLDLVRFSLSFYFFFLNLIHFLFVFFSIDFYITFVPFETTKLCQSPCLVSSQNFL